MKMTPHQMYHPFILFLFISFGLGSLSVSATPVAANNPKFKPNIIFIMADDMGYGDIQAYNSDSKIDTPNLNQLAKQGMRFTDAHAPAGLCVQTRYGLLTGQYLSLIHI